MIILTPDVYFETIGREILRYARQNILSINWLINLIRLEAKKGSTNARELAQMAARI